MLLPRAEPKRNATAKADSSTRVILLAIVADV
jgi:hypothetical protein